MAKWKMAACALLTAPVALLAGCETPPRTEALTPERADQYIWPGDVNSDRETLFIVTASGGGQRAAALTLGTLRALDAIPIGPGRTMLDEVDVISSVSGGSVTSAWFALAGRDGFDTLEREFLRQSGNAALMGAAANPITLAQLAGPGYTRLDPVIEYFEDTLFGDATYADLMGRRPYLIVNAADMGEGTAFAFTQPWFDLLCADLTAFPVADAVAASAAVPIAFAPLALQNQSPCPAQAGPDGDAGLALPPGTTWVRDGLAFDRHRDIERLQRAHVALSYLNMECPDSGPCVAASDDARKAWIHLLDGGTVDNLGLTEPLRLISTQEVPPYFLLDIVSGNVKRVVVLVISARVGNDFDIHDSGEAPGLFTMLSATISNPINAASFGLIQRLKSLIERGAENYRAELAQYGRTVIKEDEERLLQVAEGVAPDVDRFALVVDFELIGDRACRDAFRTIPTSWTLTERQVSALLHVAGPLLAANPDFAKLVSDMGGAVPAYEQFAASCGRLFN